MLAPQASSFSPITDYTLSLFICFYIIIIYSSNFFSENKLLKMFILLETNYNMLQFGMRYSSVWFSTSYHVYNKASIIKLLLSREIKD